MWLPTDPPRELLKKNHQFDLTDEFVAKAMKASVRFSGSSGGFVSANGLVVTNHHVVEGNRAVVIEGAKFKKQLARVRYIDSKYDLAKSQERYTAAGT